MTVPIWDDERVQRWLDRLDGLEAELALVSEVLFAAAELQPGMKVLDVGCGAGSTTRRAADAVAPDGSVTGIDIGAAMIDAARRAAEDRPIDWVVADVVTYDFGDTAYDVVMSRFGVMFFLDPVASFRHIRGALTPGAAVVLAAFRSPAENAWTTGPVAAVRGLLPPGPPPGPAPGPGP